MKTIAVVSTCQAAGLADALGALLPDCAVSCFDLSVLNVAEFVRDGVDLLRDFDLVFANAFEDALGPLAPAKLLRHVRRLVVVPGVIFWGFHPDLTYLPARYTRSETPLSAYHSMIALAGFVSGRTVGETRALFNPLVYGRLGFFDAYAREIDGVAAPFRRAGIDISAELARWREGGCFMHSPNHPVRDVLHDVAKAALRAAGIAFDALADLSLLPDKLAPLPRFPVYPEVASRLGVPGALMFKRRDQPGEPPRFLPLTDFVAASFERYATVPCEALRAGIGVERALRALDA